MFNIHVIFQQRSQMFNIYVIFPQRSQMFNIHVIFRQKSEMFNIHVTFSHNSKGQYHLTCNLLIMFKNYSLSCVFLTKVKDIIL